MQLVTDIEYIRQRDSLIPIAEKIADNKYGARGSANIKEREKWYGEWNYCFHSTMNELWFSRFGK